MEIQYYLHLCSCGCGGKIEIKKIHKYNGIPFYIKGHNMYGIKRTEETKQKIRESLSDEKHPMYGKQHSEETKQKIREKRKLQEHPMKGKKHTEKSKQLMSIKQIGKKRTEEQRKNISKGHKGINSKEEHWNWNNGSSFVPYPPKFNNGLKQQILERDNYTCQCPECIGIYKRLNIHHVDFNKQNNNKENFITLCNSCHAKTNNKNKRQYYVEYYQNIMMNRIMECLL